MAREGMGAPDYVFLNEDGGQCAARFYRRIASPLLLNVSVEWGGLPIEEVYPRYIPDVFTAGPVIIKGRYTQAADGFITVRGLLRGQPWTRQIPVHLPATDADGSAIATLWARERIEDLQRQDWVGAQTGNPKPDIKDAIVRVALEYRLMSQYTSFVAVEQTIVNVGGKQRTVDVPVEMPEGVSYEGIFGGAETKASSRALAQAPGSALPAGGMRGGGGGYGGWAAATPATIAGKVDSLGQGLSTSGNVRQLAEAEEATKRDRTVADGSRMKPEDRRLAARERKLSESLRAKLAKGVKGKLEVQIWLSSLPPDGMKMLKQAGFELAAQLKPKKLLLGTIDARKLDALLALPFVRAVEEPRMK